MVGESNTPVYAMAMADSKHIAMITSSCVTTLQDPANKSTVKMRRVGQELKEFVCPEILAVPN